MRLNGVWGVWDWGGKTRGVWGNGQTSNRDPRRKLNITSQARTATFEKKKKRGRGHPKVKAGSKRREERGMGDALRYEACSLSQRF